MSDFGDHIEAAREAALDLCYVACCRFDGFWEMKLHPWDVCAAALIVREAGGRTTDFQGGAFSSTCRHVLASNGFIHERMLEVLDLDVAEGGVRDGS